MGPRLAIVLVLMLSMGTVASSAVIDPAATAVAQEVGEGNDAQPQEESQTDPGGEGEGQSEPGAETDPGRAEGAEEEEGPPWTYQMARITMVLLLLTVAALGLLYHRLVVIRRREGF